MKRYEYNYGKNPEGALSTISGYATETTNFGETAFGILNKSTRDEENFTTPEAVSSSTATLFSVGNGTDHDSRKNIIELKADGTVYINGVGQYDGTNPGEATDIADEFQGIHDDITGLNEDVDRIDNTIESIHISEDNENLIYTLLVDGQERGTINIPRDQFLKNVSYNEETNNLEFTFIVRGENNEEVEKQVSVNMTDLEDIYSAGDGLNLENKQFSVKVDADTQPYIEVSSNGVKIVGINEALDSKVDWQENKTSIYLPVNGSITALRNDGQGGGVLICQRSYDDEATYVTEVGTTMNNLTLNSIERPKIDFADGTSQNVAYQSEITDISSSLDNYLPLSGGTLTGDVEMENAGLTINHGVLTVQDGLNGQISMYPNVGIISLIAQSVSNTMRIQKDISLAQGGYYPIAIDYSSEHPCIRINQNTDTTFDLSLTKDGITIKDKTENDLLNAAGGTYDISELETKVDDSLNNFYLNAYSSNQILWSASFTDNGTHGTSVRLSPATKINSGAFVSTDFYINAPLVTNEANGVMSKEDKAKLDSIDTDALATKEEVGSNIYTDSHYLGKETNLTDAILQLDEEIKATNDNLALEHANAEATYAKKTELSGYLPKSLPTAIGALYVSGTVSGVDPTPMYSMLNINGITLLDENYESRGSDTELFNTNGGTVSISDITSQVDLSDYLPLTGGTLTGHLTTSTITVSTMFALGQDIMIQNGSNGSDIYIQKVSNESRGDLLSIWNISNNRLIAIRPEGIQLGYETDTNLLLNAAGSTTSVSSIATQVQAAIVDSAPETLDTLNELAAALGDDPNFATTVTNQIAQKADKTTATTSADGLMSAADKSKLDSIETSTLATKTELEGYLPLSGGNILYRNAFNSDNFSYNHINGLGIQINNDSDSKFANPFASLCRQGYGDDLNFNLILINPKETKHRKGIFIQTLGSYDSATSPTDRSNVCALVFGDYDRGPSFADLAITRVGIFIKDKTASDLLHAAGGTTTLKTINGESLLGSGDITIPAPTVNAASGTKTIWTGTQAEYEAILTKDSNTLYFIRN